MKLIPLSQGLFAAVDDEDYERVAQFNWYAARRGANIYGMRTVKNGQKELLHRFILGAVAGQEVDHLFGNGLDNQKENPCLGSATRNHQGYKRKAKSATSQYRGVSWENFTERWKAQIKTAGTVISIGRFDCAEEAARARDAKARELGWPESGMNFPL